MIFEDAIQLVKDFNTPYIKISDTNGKRLFEIDDTNISEKTIQRLQDYKAILSSYGRVIFKAATEAQKRQNYRDAAEWSVTFGSAQMPVPNNQHVSIGAPPPGYVSNDQAILMAQIGQLRNEMEYSKKLMELEAKINSKPKQFDPEKYIPALGMFMDIDDKKLDNMVKLAQVMSVMNGTPLTPNQQNGGINGLPKEPIIKGTEEEEKIKESIEKNMEVLSEKIPIEKIDELIKILSEKPEYADMALTFAKSAAKK